VLIGAKDGGFMVGIISKPGTQEKLQILSADAQYDLACACSCNEEGRRRGGDGKWIYPVTLPNGGKSILFKTLISNVCTNDCKYCPLREQEDVRRCTLRPEETTRVFLDYYRQRKVFGLFLSSGVLGSADATMDRLNTTARLLRQRHGFRGYIHLKIIPGASNAAIEEAVSLASTVSLNIETPGEKRLAKLSEKKRYIEDIIEPMKLISRLTARGSKYDRVKQTTQFIVGAAGEPDAEIVKYMFGLYERLKMHRVYFSAYQKGLGDESIASEQVILERPADIFMREHRLYQVDFLLRKYGFSESDIVFDENGNLLLATDPKEAWALRHPERFPVSVNRASKFELLRVPGLGSVTVKRILQRRKQGWIRHIKDVGKVGVRLKKASEYLVF
jgi:predicted DNA-binding helix-hairpin-helix protein